MRNINNAINGLRDQVFQLKYSRETEVNGRKACAILYPTVKNLSKSNTKFSEVNPNALSSGGKSNRKQNDKVKI